MADQPGARRQLGEHRRLDRADALHQFSGARAELHGRRVAVAVPLQVKALPAGLEERVEADIVVLAGALDLAGAEQVQAFGANVLPMGLQRTQVREIGGVEIRPVGGFREQVKDAIDRCQKRRVITQLAAQFVPHASAQVNVCNRYNINHSNDELHGKSSHVRSEQTASPGCVAARGLVQRLISKRRCRRRVPERRPTVGLWTKDGILASSSNKLLAFRGENLAADGLKVAVWPQRPIV
ncbi:hypothetical protein PS685_05223 [Pseudomonas fluorescens]|uniref:Uncharacterized protein n=1 Tax=Pseudomonas fluorescens TaxID=294 RepID=A0A5E7A7Z3_PSEFL|nr:hypothetical protein PS685_05223 [Pseudomonas fluorescens]